MFENCIPKIQILSVQITLVDVFWKFSIQVQHVMPLKNLDQYVYQFGNEAIVKASTISFQSSHPEKFEYFRQRKFSEVLTIHRLWKIPIHENQSKIIKFRVFACSWEIPDIFSYLKRTIFSCHIPKKTIFEVKFRKADLWVSPRCVWKHYIRNTYWLSDISIQRNFLGLCCEICERANAKLQ